MQVIATLIWSAAIIFTPLFLIIGTYCSYVKGVNPGELAGRAFFAILGYVLITGLSFPVLFLAVYTAAHSFEGRSIMGGELAVFVGFAGIYVCLSYLLVCLANSRFIKPWRIFAIDLNRNLTVVDLSDN